MSLQVRLLFRAVFIMRLVILKLLFRWSLITSRPIQYYLVYALDRPSSVVGHFIMEAYERCNVKLQMSDHRKIVHEAQQNSHDSNLCFAFMGGCCPIR